MDVNDDVEGKAASMEATEQRVHLLQSEIAVREQISVVKQRMDARMLRLEQQALSDLRALKGQEMLAVRQREKRMLAEDIGKEHAQKHPAKVLIFEPDEFIERFENEISELGSVKLVANDEENVSAMNSPSSSIDDSSSIDSSFLHVGTGPEHRTREKSDITSNRSSFCFVETGTLTRRSHPRRSGVSKNEQTLSTIEDNDATPTQAKKFKFTSPADVAPSAGKVMFTILKDNKIVTLTTSNGTVAVYTPDFVLLNKVEVSSPSAICYHVAYDTITIASRHEEKEFVVLMRVQNNELQLVEKMLVDCHGKLSCMAYSSSKLYLGCSGNHIHVLDENWEEKPKMAFAPTGHPLISIACNEDVFCLVGSDGSVTYVDSLGRYLSKDSTNAILCCLVRGKPFVICRNNGIKIIESSPTMEGIAEPKTVIRTGLLDVLDMNVSPDRGELAILYWRNDNLDIRKFRPEDHVSQVWRGIYRGGVYQW